MLSSVEGAAAPKLRFLQCWVGTVVNEKLLCASVKGASQLSSADALWKCDLGPARYSNASGEAENADLIYRQFSKKKIIALLEGCLIKYF